MDLKNQNGITLFILVLSMVVMFLNLGVATNIYSEKEIIGNLIDASQAASSATEDAEEKEILELLETSIEVEKAISEENFNIANIDGVELLIENKLDDGYITYICYIEYYVKIHFDSERNILESEVIEESEVPEY